MATINFYFVSLHPIDLSKDKAESQDVAQQGTDINSYTEDLIESLFKVTTSRGFTFLSKTTEVRLAIREITENDETNDAPQAIADRLLNKEKDAQEAIKQLGVEIHKGSLLQVHFTRESLSYFLLAKVDYNAILDTELLKKRTGLPFERRVLKACLCPLDSNGEMTIVSVYDSNPKISDYWWQNFLELKEERSNEKNTEVAFESVNDFLNKKVKKQSKADYYLLRNNLIGYFRTQQGFSYDQMVDTVFGNYEPYNKDIDIDRIKKDIEKLPKKDNFDSKFDIVASVIKKRIKTVIQLGHSLELHLKDGVAGLEKIVEPYNRSGIKGILIHSEEGYETFKR